MAQTIPGGDAGSINARIERMPYCSWHNKMRAIICTAWFFDAFDSLAIAYVLPALIGAWKLQPGQIGTLIAMGFAGQLLGSIAAGWAAERWGRMNAMIGTLAVFTVMSFACALAWSYESLLWFRFIQGIGLGGEVPVMAAYVNEFARAERRGRFSIGMQALFAVGLLVVGLVGVWVVPHLGWQWSSRCAWCCPTRRAGSPARAASGRPTMRSAVSSPRARPKARRCRRFQPTCRRWSRRRRASPISSTRPICGAR
jgi:MFS family permease